jgi:integrase/recombinase XerC
MEIVTESKVKLNWKIDFESWLRQSGRSENTLKAYRQDMSAFERFFERVNGETFEPSLLTGVDLRGWRADCLAAGVAPATWNRRRATMALLSAWCQETGRVSYNPFQGVEPMEEVEQAPRWLTGLEFGKLLRTVERQVNAARTAAAKRQALRDQGLVCLMAFAGLREAEVCALDLADVELTERKGRVIVRRGKGDKRREVPLASEIRRALRAYLDLECQGPALFQGKGGERLTERGLQKRIEALANQAGISCTPHQLRHTFAKRTLDAGATLNVVGQLLGHARLDTTARYTRPGWADLENAVEGK